MVLEASSQLLRKIYLHILVTNVNCIYRAIVDAVEYSHAMMQHQTMKHFLSEIFNSKVHKLILFEDWTVPSNKISMRRFCQMKHGLLHYSSQYVKKHQVGSTMTAKIPIVFNSNFDLPPLDKCDTQLVGFVKRFTNVHADAGDVPLRF